MFKDVQVGGESVRRLPCLHIGIMFKDVQVS
jgi:hypothetical protein